MARPNSLKNLNETVKDENLQQQKQQQIFEEQTNLDVKLPFSIMPSSMFNSNDYRSKNCFDFKNV